MTALTSAAGTLSLLQEEDADFKVFAVQKLVCLVDVFWAEIADHLGEIEVLHEDQSFPERSNAALLLSKVYYHLGALGDSLNFALAAGDKFDVTSGSRYASTMISQAIDSYSQQRQGGQDAAPELEQLVNRMFEQCLQDNKLKEAIGISLEARRLDVLEKALVQSSQAPELLLYTFDISIRLLNNRAFQHQVLELLVKQYCAGGQKDRLSLARCHAALGNADALADMLFSLYTGNTTERQMALQLAFDVQGLAKQQLLVQVQSELSKRAAPRGEPAQADADSNTMDTASDEPAGVDVSQLINILSGSVLLDLHVEFLSRNSHIDRRLLTIAKEKVNKMDSVTHNAVVLSHMLMAAGTTSDDFLRTSKDWLKSSRLWAKFSAIASLGVVHKGHVKSAQTVLAPYLPGGGSSDAYETSAGLYALGLIHAGYGSKVVPQILEALAETTDETVQHGGCLGLGLASLGSARPEVADSLRNALHTDSAVAGEAAGLGLGLNAMGTNDASLLEEMLTWARSTQHEKCIRGLCLGAALIVLGQREQATTVVEDMLADKDPLIRMGGCMAMGTANVGSGDNTLTKKLLHLAVSDANDDVRRTAATSLGFVMLRHSEQLPQLVSLLCQSFNPHVRAGCCLALGIACSGTGNTDALKLLKLLHKDATPFVRQQAFVASAMILMQAKNDHADIGAFRETLSEIVPDPSHSVLSRFGATIAQGILYAGGQNVTIKPCREGGHIDERSVVGLLVFSQFWFWFPYTHFLSLAMQPTALIALNDKLQMPQIDFVSKAPPSKFAYPPKTEEPKAKATEKVETAVLSITSKVEKLKARKLSESGAMDTAADSPKPDVPETPMVEEESTEESKEDIPEPEFEMISNPARVVPAQLGVVSVPDDCRYTPIMGVHGTVVVMADSSPDEEEVIVALQAGEDAPAELAPEQQLQVPVPPPFEFDEALEQ